MFIRCLGVLLIPNVDNYAYYHNKYDNAYNYAEIYHARENNHNYHYNYNNYDIHDH